MTDFCTELFESSARRCQSTVYHFIKHNSWFVGKVYLLTNAKDYPSDATVASMRQIYSNIEVVNVSLVPEFEDVDATIEKNIWKCLLLLDVYRILYISNRVLVTGNFSKYVSLDTHIVSDDLDIIYLNGWRSPLLHTSTPAQITQHISSRPGYIDSVDYSIKSSEVPDRLYSRMTNLLNSVKFVIFDTLTTNFTISTRINLLHLHAIRKTIAYLSSPAAKVIKQSVYTPIPKSGNPNNITKNNADIQRRLPTRHILIDDIPDNSLTFDLNNQAYLKNKNKKIKLAIITGIWQRPEIVQYFAAGVKELEKLEEFDITTIISGSEGETSRKLVEDHGFIYIEIPNQPLAAKMNAPLKIAKELGVDYVLCMGSDDILHPAALLEYLKYMRSEIDFIGVTDFYFYDTTSRKSAYWGGYREQYRSGHTCGAGRALSAKILEKWDWTIWDIKTNTMLDSSMQSNLASTDHTSIYFSLKTKGLYGLDIKSSVNMTPFTLWDNTEFIDTDEIKNNFRYLALK